MQVLGAWNISATGTTQPTLKVNSGISLTGYNTVQDGAIVITASQIGIGLPTNKDQNIQY